MLRIKLIQFLIDINEKIIFYPRLRKFFKENISGTQPVIVDIGANKGQTISFFLDVFPGCIIHSFEPNKDLFKRLQQKYQGDSRVTLHNKGVSDTNGTLLFHESVLDETSTFEELNYDSEYLKMKSKVLGVKPENIIKQSYEVPVITLADFLREQQLNKIDVLKIDTEGHEFKCLQGLFGKDMPVSDISFIQLEQHYDDMYASAASSESITELLAENGYSPFGRIKHGFGDFEEVIFKSRRTS